MFIQGLHPICSVNLCEWKKFHGLCKYARRWLGSFTVKVYSRLAKRPLKINGRLADLELTSLVKEATVRQSHGWGILKLRSPICWRHFGLYKDTCYRFLILFKVSRVSPRLSCGDTCKTWIGKQCFHNGEKSGNNRTEEIDLVTPTLLRLIDHEHVLNPSQVLNEPFYGGQPDVYQALYMFPSPYIPRFMILAPVFPQSRCSPNLFYPAPVFPCTHVSHTPQSLCFPVPMFPSPCAPQSICFPVPIYRCSLVPMFPQLIYQSLCSPVLFHRSVFHFLYSPHMIPSPYVPQSRDWGTSGLGNMSGEHRDWKHFRGTSGLGNKGIGDHRDWGTSLGNI